MGHVTVASTYWVKFVLSGLYIKFKNILKLSFCGRKVK